MRKLLKRWYVWLSLVLLLGLAGSVALTLANPNRITRENFDRIQKGMSLEQVEEILGEDDCQGLLLLAAVTIDVKRWEHGPNQIVVRFLNGKVDEKGVHLLTAWETIQWYAHKGAVKIGVNWP